MIIFLVGFMGCGKSTLGRKLASTLNSEFIDLDQLVEKRIGMTIAAYFNEHGESAFRQREREVLQEAEFPVNCVVATGGGAPCFFDNMDYMNRRGVTVYISVSPAVLASRLSTCRDERPLIRNLSDEELVAYITDKLREREPFYLNARVVVEGLNITAGKVVKALGNLP